MSNIQRKFDNSSSRLNNIIPFPKDNTSSPPVTDIESIVDDIITNPKFESQIKEKVESAIIDLWVKSRMFDGNRTDDPFDAIYISALSPDNISLTESKRILKHESIKDLSDTIVFKDDWEDNDVSGRR